MLAAAGCNPHRTETSLDDMGGFALGALAYSPDNGMYILVEADAAITQYDLCQIEGDFGVNRATTGDVAGSSYCVPQAAIANGSYGWGLIVGSGRVRASAAAITAGAGFGASIAANGQIEDADTTNTVAGVLLPADAGTAARSVACNLFFPKKVT